MIFNNVILLSCTYFYDITSSDSGTIANFQNPNTNVSINFCIFDYITSSSWPGCISLNGSSFNLTHCSFSFCSASGNNAHYGNTCYVIDSNVYLRMNQFFLCAPTSISNPGDSLFYVQNCKTDVELYNSSNSNGFYGAAAFAEWYSTLPLNKLKYFNIIDGSDWDSIEIEHNSKTQLYYFNFVNTTKVTHYIINNDATPSAEIFESLLKKRRSPY